jgi:hypothetical protein
MSILLIAGLINETTSSWSRQSVVFTEWVVTLSGKYFGRSFREHFIEVAAWQKEH